MFSCNRINVLENAANDVMVVEFATGCQKMVEVLLVWYSIKSVILIVGLVKMTDEHKISVVLIIMSI